MPDNILASLLYPDAQVEQQSIARNQQLADMLRMQAMQQQPDQVVNGMVMPTSPWSGINKIAGVLSANNMQSGIDERSQALNQRMAQGMNEQYNQMLGGSPTPGDIGQVGIQSNPQVEKLRAAAKAALLVGNKDLANKLIGNMLEFTNEQKNMAALGQDPLTMGRLDQAAKAKQGIIELQPGTTAVNLATGGERYQPQMTPGIQYQDGQASPVPGYAQANAALQGASTRATEGAKSETDMVTVDTPDGPRMMTKAQALQMAKPEAGLTGNFKGSAEDVIKQIMAIPDPQERTNALSAYANQMTGNNKPGIALQDESAKKFGSTVASTSAESLMTGRDKAKTAADDLLNIQQTRDAIKAGAFQGAGAEKKLAIAKFINANVPGINVDAEKVGNTDYLISTLGSGLLAQAKTLGTNPTDTDAKRIEQIVGSIGKDPGAMQKMLDWREEMAKRAISNHNNLVDDAEKRGLKSQFDLRIKLPEIKTSETKPASKTPTAGMVQDGYRFKGGNPADKNNWEPI